MNEAARLKVKKLFVLALSLILLAASVWEFHLRSYERIPIYLLGAALGVFYLLRGGSLPDWIYEGWDFFGYLGLKRDDDPKNLPSKYALPIGIGILLALSGIVIYIVFSLCAASARFEP